MGKVSQGENNETLPNENAPVLSFSFHFGLPNLCIST